MKKVKIMLSAIVVLAAVGGALAFKATKVSDLYCVGDRYNGIDAVSFCPEPKAQTTIEAQEFFYATPTDNPDNCPNILCPTVKVTDQQ
jgi:hypothetical protein